ncbi:MAG: hypothetical protein V7K94_31485 [Nostoc sp.]|uniref:hypothetical protein n=1 Tax=Nostoc sp. TaxID=1180 RepID=UPI002FFD1B85
MKCQCQQCEADFTWECDQCHRLMPYCWGQSGDTDLITLMPTDTYAETCDQCWARLVEFVPTKKK